VELRREGTKPPLFCVHTLGGHLFHYFELVERLPTDQPVYGLQARGVYGECPPDHRIADIAADCLHSMRQRQPMGPYRLLGYSSGGIVAFEMAQQLRRAGEEVRLLGLIDSYGPDTRLDAEMRVDLAHLRTRPGRHRWREYLTFLLLHSLGLDRLQPFPSAGLAHRWAHWSYRPRSYPGSVDLFYAEASERSSGPPLLGWARWATGELRVHRTSGSHSSTVKPPDVDALAARVRAWLELDPRGGTGSS
jgi:thioesterase domain-containing protein